VRVESNVTSFTQSIAVETVLRMPIAHHEGSYFVDETTLSRMEKRGQVVLRYCTEDGQIEPAANPNGSVSSIAGVCNEPGNVFGLMPHPERCSEAILGGVDGLRLFESMARSEARKVLARR